MHAGCRAHSSTEQPQRTHWSQSQVTNSVLRSRGLITERRISAVYILTDTLALAKGRMWQCSKQGSIGPFCWFIDHFSNFIKSLLTVAFPINTSLKVDCGSDGKHNLCCITLWNLACPVKHQTWQASVVQISVLGRVMNALCFWTVTGPAQMQHNVPISFSNEA